MTQKNKLKVRMVPATTLKPGDIFFDVNGEMAKIVFRAQASAHGKLDFSCIDSDGLPRMVSFDKGQHVTKVTDPRVYAPQEA